MDRPGNYVEPTIISGLKHDDPIVHKESFVPVLYVIEMEEGTLEEGVRWNNEVDQGLTSALFTQNVGNIFHWMGWVM